MQVIELYACKIISMSTKEWAHKNEHQKNVY